MKTLAAIALTLLAGTASAMTLHDNGPAVDANGFRLIGNTLGLAAGPGFDAAIADDFTVTAAAGWNVTGFNLFAFTDQNTSSDPAIGVPLFQFVDVRWTIVRGDDVNLGEVVASDQTVVTNGGMLGFNAYADDLTNRRDAIFRIQANIPDVSLDPGHYWLTWSFDSYLTAVQTPVSGEPAGNGLNTFRSSEFQDRGLEFPFQLEGSVNGAVVAVPEPSTYASLLAGLTVLAGVASRRRRALGAAQAAN